MTYDAAGRRTAITEANTGTTTFDYNALGELITTIDAKDQHTAFAYDALGRLTTRTDRAGTPDAVTNTYTWDPLHATGALAEKRNGPFTQRYAYRALDGKLDEITTTIDVPDLLTRTYTQGCQRRTCLSAFCRDKMSPVFRVSVSFRGAHP